MTYTCPHIWISYQAHAIHSYKKGHFVSDSRLTSDTVIHWRYQSLWHQLHIHILMVPMLWLVFIEVILKYQLAKLHAEHSGIVFAEQNKTDGNFTPSGTEKPRAMNSDHPLHCTGTCKWYVNQCNFWKQSDQRSDRHLSSEETVDSYAPLNNV